MARAEEPVKLILRPRYRFGPGDSSVKIKNPAAPAVKQPRTIGRNEGPGWIGAQKLIESFGAI
jgi:hypothetical protein